MQILCIEMGWIEHVNVRIENVSCAVAFFVKQSTFPLLNILRAS